MRAVDRCTSKVMGRETIDVSIDPWMSPLEEGGVWSMPHLHIRDGLLGALWIRR